MSKKKKTKKYAVTLIEIMIVILLIGLISGALVFNMRGSLDKGKNFKTEQNAQKVYDALMMAHAEGKFQLSQVGDSQAVLNVLNQSPFIKNGTQSLRDGWGDPLIIEQIGNDDIKVYSNHVPQ